MNILTEDIRAKKANKITWIGFFANLILTSVKLIAGIIGNSTAMIADAIHSLSDFTTDIIILISFKIVRKPSDKDHNYGHGKFETLATTIIGIALFVVGIGILYSSGENIYSAMLLKTNLESPRIIALITALLSMITKEILFRITLKAGEEINSSAVIANAWHHRSDAFSSIGTFIGIGGSILLGDNWRVLDPIAATIVSIFIMKTAYGISIGSIKELLEESLDDSTNKNILEIIENINQVISPHELKTRRVGNKIIIDIHINVKNNLSIVEAHKINDEIERKIKKIYGDNTIINIHTEPEDE
ncbi:cation diffusion facilitator family transporter [Halanaerobium congolense]|uniref:Cation diffusion facilitator family transporter n=1 Tax=Halanaerobium congolense TaxID=54121 RepID=A0A1I0DCI5_9FIRM|nr:cation diffusion facilitator family transporter [Halanaerobium congolense]PTX16658.1 cation diffusion facilitator family transporter [Halanaerobium congolense]SDG28717.1 cation diffusion facilitator family transporter [Halanaerobium congolense]SDH92647.1 cation diffusion facilitator family transporter [Halanaerobium congolense]SET30036.1 cation diffusion facilitator family transporter [Halanaerobium congolense]SFP83786.1 cation diffusion facilitator family transporter [Halanaerobium congole